SQKSYVSSVRRPSWTAIRCGVIGQANGVFRTYQLDVDISVVLLGSVPDECYLVAVGREGWAALGAKVTGQRKNFWGRNIIRWHLQRIKPRSHNSKDQDDESK